ncbi:unnamed protein product, partial [Meganyctiphanes norvegica]
MSAKIIKLKDEAIVQRAVEECVPQGASLQCKARSIFAILMDPAHDPVGPEDRLDPDDPEAREDPDDPSGEFDFEGTYASANALSREHFIDEMEQRHDLDHRVMFNILDAIYQIDEAWKQVLATTIQRTWNKLLDPVLLKEEIATDRNLTSFEGFTNEVPAVVEDNQRMLRTLVQDLNNCGPLGLQVNQEDLLDIDFKSSVDLYANIEFCLLSEVGGSDGARHISAILAERGVSLEFLIDEGMVVLEDIMPGMDVPVACIGVSEKGWMTIKVETSGVGGHSSMPPPAENSAVGQLSAALHKLHQKPQPSQFGKGPEEDMFTYIAPKSSWPYKYVYGNTWLFKPILEAVMSSSRETNAIIRTTTAVTIVQAGVKENVIPTSASAIINHRVHPGQTLEEVLEYDRAVINDPQVKLTVLNQHKPHPVSPYGSQAAGYRLIAANVARFFPGAVTTPSILVGNTDTKHYLNFTQNVYRFMPLRMIKKLISTVHGIDERISVNALRTGIKFYHRFIQTADLEEKAYKSPSVLGMKENEL